MRKTRDEPRSKRKAGRATRGRATRKRSSKRRTARAKLSVGSSPRAKLPAELHHSPAGYLADGSRIASLHEVLSPEIPTKPLGELSHAERTGLALERLRSDPRDVRLRMLGVPGVLNKDRMIAEIEASSHIGMHLVDIEIRFIRMLIEQG